MAVFMAISIDVTVPDSSLLTRAVFPSGVIAIASRPGADRDRPPAVPVAVAIGITAAVGGVHDEDGPAVRRDRQRVGKHASGRRS